MWGFLSAQIPSNPFGILLFQKLLSTEHFTKKMVGGGSEFMYVYKNQTKQIMKSNMCI